MAETIGLQKDLKKIKNKGSKTNLTEKFKKDVKKEIDVIKYLIYAILGICVIAFIGFVYTYYSYNADAYKEYNKTINSLRNEKMTELENKVNELDGIINSKQNCRR